MVTRNTPVAFTGVENKGYKLKNVNEQCMLLTHQQTYEYISKKKNAL